MYSKLSKLFITVAAMMATVSMSAQAVAPNMTGMTKDAHAWCQEVKVGWNLGNSLESSGADWDAINQKWKNDWIANYDLWETGWGNPATTQAMIDRLRANGINAVRIPVRWGAHCIDQKTMKVSSAWMKRVKEVVDYCYYRGMYIILNAHHELWLENRPYYKYQDDILAREKALWINIANEFADYDGHLAFAGTNEVQDNWKAPTEENAAVQNSYNQTFVDAVRSTGGRNYYRNLIVQTYACSPYYGLQYFTIPQDVVENRLSVEFHYYDPYDYCSGDAKSYYYWGKEYAYTGAISPSGNENTITNLFTQIKELWYDKGLGVIVGEYGISDHYKETEKTQIHANMQYYLKTLVTAIRQFGYAGFAWDNNVFGNGTEKFGIFNRNNNMSIDAPYFFNGIIEGSKAAYDPNIGKTENEGDDTGGKVIWSGNELLDWGDGLQLSIPGYQFKSLKGGDMLVLYFTQVKNSDYEGIELFYGNWSSKPSFTIDGKRYSGSFDPKSFYGTNGESHVTSFVFDDATMAKLQSLGLVIQGHGVYLTKAVLIDAATASGIEAPHVGPSSNAIYTLQGIRVTEPTAPGIYIINGKKVRK